MVPNVTGLNPGWAIQQMKTVCQPSSKYLPFLNQEKTTAAKEDRWARPFICCAPTALSLWPLGYKKPLPFFVFCNFQLDSFSFAISFFFNSLSL